jgi:hypothetical protein
MRWQVSDAFRRGRAGRGFVESANIHTLLYIPLRKNEALLGFSSPFATK